MDTLIELRPGRRIKLSLYKTNPLHPTLFMIHGMGGRGYQWREQVKHLKERYTLIVPDLLGQGDSEKPLSDQENLYSFKELSQDLQVLFERYASDMNCVFGHSYGGAFATFLAKTYPAQVSKLVLIAPVSCQPFHGVPLAYSLPLSVLEFLRPYLDRSFERLAFAVTDDPLLLKTEKEGRDLNNLTVIKSLLQGMKTIPALSVKDLEVPSLIVCGSLDRIVPVAAVRAFYTRLPQHQLFVLENTAHLPHLEKSHEVNRLLDNFLYR